jgi:butyryl-CoA dehydrogenase
MKVERYSRQSLDFLLHDVLRVQDLAVNESFAHVDSDLIGQTLDLADQLADKFLAPHFKEADDHQPTWSGQRTQVHPGISAYIRAAADTGLLAAPFPGVWGGQQLPRSVSAAVQFVTGSANNSFVMFTDLIRGVARLILSVGSDEQRNRYLPKLLSGTWAATMCLTEPDAGSALAEITTKAIPESADAFLIFGQKTFISAGDHDATENIIHLVLARIEGSPAGVKGLSLFVVPKYLDTVNGDRISNGVETISIIHKMGQTATPATQLAFGQGMPCTGYLLGKPNEGLKCMFKMMNDARLDTGLAGAYIASAAYYFSLSYAKERTQGKHNGVAVRICTYPDVRRMLMTQKVHVEGVLCLALQCYLYIDQYDATHDPRYKLLLDLLTPVVKAYGSECGNWSVYNAMQVLGGYGYTRDFPVEQLSRDVRVLPIYEGTNGIQGVTLLGRMLRREAVELWVEQAMVAINKARQVERLRPFADQLFHHVQSWEETAKAMLRLKATDAPQFLADANLFMTYFGILNLSLQWLRMGDAAWKRMQESDLSDDDKAFFGSKLLALEFFYQYELQKCQSVFEQLQSHHTLTVGDIENLII